MLDVEAGRGLCQAVLGEVAKTIVGQEEAVRGILLAMLARGHVLLEGVPGLGKTLLVKTFAQALDLAFARIQFTPDLMPADIIGTTVVHETEQGGHLFRFERGPIFAQIILADEINRATPKTQSALLEAMQESSVTVGGVTYPLPEPFFVLATQNPIEMEGTYPLPEAQLDRFLLKISLDYPPLPELRRIVEMPQIPPPAPAVASGLDLQQLQATVAGIPLGEQVRDYVARLVMATHPGPATPGPVKEYVRFGASPRGAQCLASVAKAHAWLRGAVNVSFADVRAVLAPCLHHRLILNFQATLAGVAPDVLLAAVVAAVPELPGADQLGELVR